jgi:outer membrane protein assembly factor BamD (BamD/ComL family)
MKIETTWKDLNRIPWQAIFWCAEEYKRTNPGHNDHDYFKYMKDNWGIVNGPEHIQIVDEKKYTMFVLRWS